VIRLNTLITLQNTAHISSAPRIAAQRTDAVDQYDILAPWRVSTRSIALQLWHGSTEIKDWLEQARRARAAGPALPDSTELLHALRHSRSER
jgi:hypothetical protein